MQLTTYKCTHSLYANMLSLSLSQYWEHRLQQLVFVREQLNSAEVLHILSGLEHARSTYANAFIDAHRDVSKVCVH